MNEVEVADRAGRKRARLIMASAGLFVITQAVSFGPGHSASRPESVRLVAWVVWAIVLLLLLAGVGGWAQPPGVRAMLNDELTRENRRASMVIGFWAAIGMAAFSWGLAITGQVSATEVPRLVITFALATALFSFAFAERRAHRDD